MPPANPSNPEPPPSQGFTCGMLAPGLVRGALARLVSARQDPAELGRLVDQYAQTALAEGADPRWLFGTLEPPTAGESESGPNGASDAGPRSAPEGGPMLGQVCMLAASPGRTVGVYVSRDAEPIDLPSSFEGARLSRASRDGRAAQRVAVVEFARNWLIARSATGAEPAFDLAQALIEPHHADVREALLRAGFSTLAELGYMRTEVPRTPQVVPAWPPGVRVTSLASLGWPASTDLLLRAMARSYEGTLDCPALCGIRRTQDVLASHLAVGAFDPALWFIVFAGDAPEGCMLLTRFDEHETAELVYLGLGPPLRGKGLGASLLSMAMTELSVRGATALACAVDGGNEPALKLYKAAKFRRFARRVGFIADVRATGRVHD